jgi:hypothetical protein
MHWTQIALDWLTIPKFLRPVVKRLSSESQRE